MVHYLNWDDNKVLIVLFETRQDFFSIKSDWALQHYLLFLSSLIKELPIWPVIFVQSRLIFIIYGFNRCQFFIIEKQMQFFICLFIYQSYRLCVHKFSYPPVSPYVCQFICVYVCLFIIIQV